MIGDCSSSLVANSAPCVSRTAPRYLPSWQVHCHKSSWKTTCTIADASGLLRSIENQQSAIKVIQNSTSLRQSSEISRFDNVSRSHIVNKQHDHKNRATPGLKPSFPHSSSPETTPSVVVRCKNSRARNCEVKRKPKAGARTVRRDVNRKHNGIVPSLWHFAYTIVGPIVASEGSNH